METLKRIFFLPPGDAIIAAYKNVIGYMNKPEIHTLNLPIPPDVPEQQDVSMMAELLLALQHYPSTIEKMILSLQFKFQMFENSELYFPEDDWKTAPVYYRWFNKMFKQFTPTIFFINDEDARFYCLAGDMLAAGKVKLTGETDGKRSAMEFTAKQTEILAARLFNACHLMMIYCHGSGFNPASYIEGMIALFNLPVEYSDVYKAYEHDIKNNVKFRIAPKIK